MADDFSEKLTAVLGNQEAMGQIMSLARSLTGEGGQPVEGAAPAAPEPFEPGESPLPRLTAAEPPQLDIAGLLGALGGIMGGGGGSGGSGGEGNPLSALSQLDPRLIQLGMRFFSEYSREDDRKVALLTALKPFLKEERAAKIDRAAQAAKLARLARVALQLFREGRGEDV